MSARDELRALARNIAGLANAPTAAALAAAPLVAEAIKTTAAAGKAPDGTPWPLKADGSRALVHAADRVSARAEGSAVVVNLEGPEVFHQAGAQGKPVRKVIPDAGELPEPVAAAAKAGAEKAIAQILGGG